MSRAFRIVLASLLSLMSGQRAYTQSNQPPSIDLAGVGIMNDMADSTFVAFSNSRDLAPAALPSLPFSKGTRKYSQFIPPGLVNATTIMKFSLSNSSDSVQHVFFCPGFLFRTIDLYIIEDSLPGATRVNALPPILPDDKDSLGYRGIDLRPHQRATYFAVLSFVRTATNALTPTLTRASFIQQGIVLNRMNKTSIDVMTNLFAGILLMMIFYALSEYWQTAKPEFLYYAVYAICISSLLFLKSILHRKTIGFNFIFEGYADNIIFCTGYVFYIIFHRRFLETEKNYPSLDRWLYRGYQVVIVLAVLFSIAFFALPDFRVANFIEDATKIFLLLLLAVFIWKGMGYNEKLMNYIVAGNISLCLLSIVSQLMISFNFRPVKGLSLFNLSLFYYEAGITIELLFFLFALTFKNKKELVISIQKEEQLKLETERKELEKQVAVLAATQDERNRISADMHDELGSGVTAIRLMSEIVKSKMKEDTLPEIDKISNSANELLNKMNTIIWTMTSSNDSVENLVAYIRSYAVEFFENTTIDCHFSIPAFLPPHEISGEKRRNVFLSVKEALNNVLKHSQGSSVRISVAINDKLLIEIRDNGVGINMEKLRKFGNGLNNMKKRMASIDGQFDISNQEGTKTSFYLAL
jgi:signal transduction histidine kinase